LHRFQVIADYWSNFRCRQWYVNKLVRVITKVDVKKLETLIYHMVWNIFRHWTI